MSKLLISALAASASLGLASAQDVKVEIETWMLETDAGTEHVYNMLTRKAERACKGVKPGTRIRSLDEECAADLLNQFVDGIDHPSLSRVHTGDVIRLADAQ